MPEPALPLAVVVITWNSAEVIATCLDALAASTPPPAELVIVDNASADGTRDAIAAFQAAHAAIATRLVANDANRGFAPAANQGIAASAQPYVALVNPDLRVLPTTLPVLAAALEAAPPELAVVGAKLLRAVGDTLTPTEVIDATGMVMTRDGRHFDRGAGEADIGQYDREEDVFGITGALAVFRRTALEHSKVDGEVFDEDFFAYREDADLAWRLRGFGYRARYMPAAVAYHRRTVTPERRRSLSAAVNRHSVKNRFLLRFHHADRAWLVRFAPRWIVRDLVVVGGCLTIEWSSLGAFPWLARNHRRHLRRRREILARRTVSSAALRMWFH